MPNETEVVLRTRKDVQALSAAEIRRRMKDPTLNEDMQKALMTPDAPAEEPVDIVLSQEEIDAAAAQKAADEAEAVEASKKAAEAEAAKKAADQQAAEAVKAAEAARPVRKVFEYQVTDDAGNPIGNKTHIEYSSEDELAQKMQAAHVNAMRLADRLRKTKPVTPKPIPAGLLTKAEYDKAQNDLLSDDKEEAAAAKKKLLKHREAAQGTSEDAIRLENIRQAEEGYKFMSAHVSDFYPCAANSNVLMDYLKENNLEYTADNLEFALVRIGDKLAPRPGVRVPSVEPNPPAAVVPAPPAPPVVPAPPAVVPPTPPAASAPVPPVAVPNPPAPAPRQAPNGGIEPGTMGGGRAPQSTALTLKDVAKWSASQMKKNMEDPKVAAQVKKLIFDRNEAVRKAKQLA